MRTSNEIALAFLEDRSEGQEKRFRIGNEEIIAQFGNNFVRVYPVDGNLRAHYNFSATVNQEGYFESNVHSKDEFGNKLPGFHAKELFLLALTYLSKRNSVLGIKGVWQRKRKLSDNFAMFSRNLDSRMNSAEAAFNTWTGKIAQELGYRSVHISTDDPSYICAYFVR